MPDTPARPRRAARLISLLAAAALLLPACNFREGALTPTPGGFSEPERTAAAQTIVAQLTKVSLPTVDETALALTPSATPAPATVTPTRAEPAQLTLTAFAFETSAAAAQATEDAAAPTAAAPTAPATQPGGGAATPEAAPTGEAETTPDATATPGASPTASPTPVPGDPAAELGEPDWEDDFSTGGGWAFYTDEFASFQLADGGLRMTALQTGARNSWMLAVPRPPDYYLELTARTGECSGLDRYGVIFRSDANVGYLFAFSCDGQYSLRRWNGARALVLVDWTSSPALLSGPDQTNRLGLRVEGGTFTLYANGTRLDEVADASLSETGFGLFIGAENTDDFSVVVERAAYWELP